MLSIRKKIESFMCVIDEKICLTCSVKIDNDAKHSERNRIIYVCNR